MFFIFKKKISVRIKNNTYAFIEHFLIIINYLYLFLRVFYANNVNMKID